MQLHGEDDAHQEWLRKEAEAAAERQARQQQIVARQQQITVEMGQLQGQIATIQQNMRWAQQNSEGGVDPTPFTEQIAQLNAQIARLGQELSGGAAAPPPPPPPPATMIQRVAAAIVPAPAPEVQIKTVYQAPNPPAPLDLFPKVQATAVPAPPPPPSATPMVAQPATPSSPFLPSPTSYQTLAPSASATAPAAGSSLPSWVIPAAIGAAALVVALPLLSRKRRS